jgi:hypothetical protein
MVVVDPEPVRGGTERLVDEDGLGGVGCGVAGDGFVRSVVVLVV